MRLCALIALLFVLSACGGAETTSTLVPPETLGGRMCTNQCRLAEDYCSEACNMTQRSCVNTAQAQALKDYDKYTREQYAANQPIDLYESDFERLAPCNTAYDACYQKCENTHEACYSQCGGKVDVTTSCQFLCF